MKGLGDPTVKTCDGLIAGRIQKSADPSPGCSAVPHAQLKHMSWGRVKGRCVFGSTVANSIKKSTMLNDVYVLGYWLLSVNAITVGLVQYWDQVVFSGFR